MHIQALARLFALFCFILLLIGRGKGLRSIAALLLSAVIISKGIIPLITHGFNPILVALLGGVLIITTIVYLTEGFNIKGTLAVASVIACSLITLGLAWLFIGWTHLNGLTSEIEASISVYGTHRINLPELLLAGMIIGTLGILSETVISQISAVEGMYTINRSLPWHHVYRQAHAIGIAHLTSIINTLFLIYASVTLPLLIVFIGNHSTLSDIFNTDVVATEVVRTLTGAIGVALSIPLATFLASWWLRPRNKQ